jgi:uncharacterized protein
MLLIDANILLNAANEDAPEHERAHRWLLQALAGPEAVGFAWTVVLAFLRVSTHPSIFPASLDPEHAGTVVERWLEAPHAVIVEPTRRHFALLRGLLARVGTGGNLVGDAHLAALALEHDATVVSFDRDFARFDGVRLRVPD